MLGSLVKWFHTAPRSQDDDNCNVDVGDRMFFAITNQCPSCLTVSTRPKSEEEKERSSRTVYCTNIQKTVTPDELINFFQIYFGQVSHVRIMGHENHATKIAFIEFMEASGAIAALSSSSIYVQGLIIRFDP
ncbi:hypothetical protein QYE76_004538 [Lolium multiflorum]|uniref:RRM domain-containing protein n=1 Tax=Lolium multiflorum TaxID=4521 RepID=A0AAD8RQW8_LOLMU|nr:hypothetical protein QYE76_004538 [Lolium multiflorum]